MDPPSQSCEENIGDKRPKDTKNHDISKVLEEPFAAHIVAWSKNDRWNAEVEQDIVIENNILLDGVIVAHECSQTD